ncbi:MAG: 6-phosphofructokinase [Pirellulaceae bacterium]
MRRIGILTAGGDTPALNATLFGAVTQASQNDIEVVGLLNGFDSLYHPRAPHVVLNPLFCAIPELDPNYGGSILGSSRRYVDSSDRQGMKQIQENLTKLKLDGLVCIGGDGTLNALQPLCDILPTSLAPKTIDNDLGMNYPNEPDKYVRESTGPGEDDYSYRIIDTFVEERATEFQLDRMINYATPGYATAVFVSVGGIRRIRTTAESHRRIAIIEVMGRHSGFIALGSAYGQPDIILVPESPLDIELVAERVKQIYRLQKHVVIVCGEGIVDKEGEVLGDRQTTLDPSGNVRLSGAAEALRTMLLDHLDDSFFHGHGYFDSASSAIFTRKVGHTQRGGRPIQFDRFYAAQLGGKALEILLDGGNNEVSTLKWSADSGFDVSSYPGNGFRDQWGLIHARRLHPSFYDTAKMNISPIACQYLLPIFTKAIGADDVEFIRETRFDSGNLYRRFHSVNTDIEKRTRYV